MRRKILIYLLILAVIGAAGALAYYSYSYSVEVSTREREIIEDTTRELAEEKVVGLETQLVEADRKIFAALRFEPLSDLKSVVATYGPLVRSILVLDASLHVVPGGYAGQPDPGGQFRDFVVRDVVPGLDLPALEPGMRRHTHREFGGLPYLFSYSRHVVGGTSYYVVLEQDLRRIVAEIFPQFFAVGTSRLFQVLDDRDELVYGVPVTSRMGAVVVELTFAETFDRWRLRVSQKDIPSEARGRRRVLDALTIGGALAIVLAGLAFLVLAMRRERRANELKSEFISNVSHELKTPLSIISMFGELLAAGRTKDKGQATEYAEIIWREAVRLSRLIDNVLDFAKLERGGNVYEFVETDLPDLVGRALELSVHRLSTAAITSSFEVEGEVPQVLADPTAMTLVVLNLIDNAIKYAPNGKSIEVRVGHHDTHAWVRVTDHGPGIPEAEQALVFDRFYRGQAVRLPIRGSGIGLSLVKHIATAHGGHVTLRSTPGQGAEFTVWIPTGSKK